MNSKLVKKAVCFALPCFALAGNCAPVSDQDKVANFNVQTSENVAQSQNIGFYGGIGLNTSWTKSDFGMHLNVNQDYFPYAGGYAGAKKTINKIGYNLFLGLDYNFNSNWFVAGEFDLNLNHAKHGHDFMDDEGIEIDPRQGDGKRISYVNVCHGNELGLSAKVGRHFDDCDLYGILGIATKQVGITYSFDDSNVNVYKDFSTNFKKRIYSFVAGAGVSKKISKHISCAMEYKYKIYGNANKSVDLVEPTKEVLGPNGAGGFLEHDIGPRNFKVKTDKHEISLRFIIGV